MSGRNPTGRPRRARRNNNNKETSKTEGDLGQEPQPSTSSEFVDIGVKENEPDVQQPAKVEAEMKHLYIQKGQIQQHNQLEKLGPVWMQIILSIWVTLTSL